MSSVIALALAASRPLSLAGSATARSGAATRPAGRLKPRRSPRIAALCLSLAVSASTALAAQTDRGVRAGRGGTSQSPGTYHALLFAADQYDSWSPLVNPINDAHTLSDDLRNNYGFTVDLVENPTKQRMLLKIRQYATREWGENDHLLIFFAGHGHYDDIDAEGYLVARDSELEARDPAHETLVPHSTLRQRVNAIPVEHLLLVIDACFGGTFDQRVADRGDIYADISVDQLIDLKLPYKTRRFITSGGKEYVSDGRPGQHSPFMRRFLEALRGFGGSDRVLTLAELGVELERVQPQPVFGEWGDNQPGSDFLMMFRGATTAGGPRPTTGGGDTNPTRGGSTATLTGTRSIRSVNYPDRFIRHRDGLAVLQPVAGAADRRAASFILVPGLSDPTGVSFRSVDQPNHYLRHSSFVLRLGANDGSALFQADATFRAVEGLAGRGTSIQSVNYPRRYLRHSSFALYLHEPDGSDLFRKDATFEVVVAVSEGGGSAGSAQPPAERAAFATFQTSDRVWTARNVDVEAAGSMCPGARPEACRDFGRLYTRQAAQGVCSTLGTGWRIPSDADYRALVAPYGRAYGDDGTGQDMFGPLTNPRGFGAQLAGKRFVFEDEGGAFGDYDGGQIGYYWTSGVAPADGSPRSRFIIYTFRSSDRLVLREASGGSSYYSVRCVRDR